MKRQKLLSPTSSASHKKINSGWHAQQNGEVTKNKLTNLLSFDESNKSDYDYIRKSVINKVLCDTFGVGGVELTTAKSYADGGEKSKKPDLVATMKLNLGSGKVTNKKVEMSLKSTFGPTQLSIHSVQSFFNHLSNCMGVVASDNVIKFFCLFTGDFNSWPGGSPTSPLESVKKIISAKGGSVCAESIRRSRFNIEEIDIYDPHLFNDVGDFIYINRVDIFKFLAVCGTAKVCSDVIVFCNKSITELAMVKVSELLEYVKNCDRANVFYKPLATKVGGTTTLRLFGGLVPCQMKGSGQGAAYHGLQFRISGNHVINTLGFAIKHKV